MLAMASESLHGALGESHAAALASLGGGEGEPVFSTGELLTDL